MLLADVFAHMASWLSLSDVQRVMVVSRSFRHVARTDAVWELLFRRDVPLQQQLTLFQWIHDVRFDVCMTGEHHIKAADWGFRREANRDRLALRFWQAASGSMGEREHGHTQGDESDHLHTTSCTVEVVEQVALSIGSEEISRVLFSSCNTTNGASVKPLFSSWRDLYHLWMMSFLDPTVMRKLVSLEQTMDRRVEVASLVDVMMWRSAHPELRVMSNLSERMDSSSVGGLYVDAADRLRAVACRSDGEDSRIIMSSFIPIPRGRRPGKKFIRMELPLEVASHIFDHYAPLLWKLNALKFLYGTQGLHQGGEPLEGIPTGLLRCLVLVALISMPFTLFGMAVGNVNEFDLLTFPFALQRCELSSNFAIATQVVAILGVIVVQRHVYLTRDTPTLDHGETQLSRWHRRHIFLRACTLRILMSVSAFLMAEFYAPFFIDRMDAVLRGLVGWSFTGWLCSWLGEGEAIWKHFLRRIVSYGVIAVGRGIFSLGVGFPSIPPSLSPSDRHYFFGDPSGSNVEKPPRVLRGSLAVDPRREKVNNYRQMVKRQMSKERLFKLHCGLGIVVEEVLLSIFTTGFIGQHGYLAGAVVRLVAALSSEVAKKMLGMLPYV